ncbi:cupin, partial [Mesorhizobium sp. M7A.F.Ca.CA.001.12.2.1]
MSESKFLSIGVDAVDAEQGA